MGSCDYPFIFTNGDLKNAVNEWVNDSDSAEIKYGHISDWDVSSVNCIYYMFDKANQFNQDLINWVTDSVTNAWRIFYRTPKMQDSNKPSLPNNTDRQSLSIFNS